MEQRLSKSASSNNMSRWGPLRTRGYRHNNDQKMFLVSFMEANPEFAFGRYVGPRQKAQALWVQLTEEMNARGPKKTVAQWQKAWTDVKSRARLRVYTKANNPSFDSVNDLDARVLALLDSANENSNSTSLTNSTDYGVCDSGMDETDAQTTESHFLHSLKVEAPEVIFFPEAEGRPESVESVDSCTKRHPDGGHTEESHPDSVHLNIANQGTAFDSEDVVQDLGENGDYNDIIDMVESHVADSASNSKGTRKDYHQRDNLTHIRNRWRQAPSQNVSNVSSPSSNLHRRQTETFEAISKALLLSAENERERNQLMSQNLEINKARLKADIQRNDLLRDLLSTVKSLATDKNLLFD